MPEPSPRFRWILPDGPQLRPDLIEAGAARGLSSVLLGVLAARGHSDAHALAELFDDPVRGLHDPLLLPGAEAFRARIGTAVLRRERVMVFGDFDADGLTGLAIFVRALSRLGLDASAYVPDRAGEGHGLSVAAIDRCQAEGRTVIVTVDCGVSSTAEIAVAATRGIDVLVTDHHRAPPVLPQAAAIVDPHLPGSRYPYPALSGSGVAFKLAQLVLGDVAGGAAAALDLADLAAIGSIADLVSMTGENRAIVRLGLARLRSDPRPAIAALLAQAGIATERVDPDAIAYGVAPRLNAVGRMGHAGVAAALLLSDDADRSVSLAAELEAANVARRDVTAAALVEARDAARAASAAPAVVLCGEWPVGVIGLVAGRLSEDLGVPCVVVSRSVDPWRVSARSPAGFDLAAAFGGCADLFERHGGHAAAAGASIRPERFPEFRARFLDLAAGFPAPDPVPSLRLDLVVEARAVDYALYRKLAPLDATGELPPLTGIRGLVVGRVRGASGDHLQLTLRRGPEVLDGVCFGRAAELAWIREGQHVDVVARIGSRSFGGFESLQLEIRDIAPAGLLGGEALAA